MPTTPVIPFDNSVGATPTLADILDSPVSYQVPHPRGESRSDNLDVRGMNLDELVDTIPTKPNPNAKTADIYTPAKGTERYPTFNPQYDNEDMYGKDQGSLNQFLLSGAVKGLGKGLISLAQTLTFQPKADWADNAKDYLDNVLLPSYRTEKQQNSNFNWIPFSGGAANFYGDKILGGTFDMAGMIAGTAVQAAAISALTEGIGEAVALPEQMANLTMKLSKYLTGMDKTAEFLKDAGIEGDALSTAYRDAKMLQANKLVKTGINQFANTGTNFLFSHYMAAQGEHQTYKSVKDELEQKYINEHGSDPEGVDAANIEKTANSIANASYYTDLTLFMGQAMALPGLLRMFRPAGGIIKGVEAQMGDIELLKAPKVAGDVDVLTPKLKEGGFKGNVLKPFIHNAAVLGGITAATETGHEAIKKFFEDRYNKKSEGTVNDAIADLGDGLSKTFGTSEGIGGIFTSALIGGLIGPGEHLMREAQYAKAGLPDVNKVTTDAVQSLGQWKASTDVFDNTYQGAKDAATAQRDMADALASNDPFKYKSAQKDAFFNFINSGIKNNLHDVRIAQLELIKHLPDAEIHSMFGEDKTSILDKKQYIDKLIDKANKIKAKKEAISEIVPQTNVRRAKPKNKAEEDSNEAYEAVENYKDILTKMSYDKEEYANNLDELELKNKETHPLLTNSLLEKLTTKEGRELLRKQYSDEIDYLETQLHNKAGSTFHASDLKDQAERRDILKKMRDSLGTIQGMSNVDPIIYSKIFGKVLNFELNGRRDGIKDAVPMEQNTALINRGVEVQQNKEAGKEAANGYASLFSDKGFRMVAENMKEYKAGLSVADDKKTFDENKANPDYQVTKAEPGESRFYILDREADFPGYTVSKSSRSDDTTEYNLKDLKGNIVKSFDKIKDANDAAREYNKEIKYPEKISTTGELNGDGSIKAKDESGNDISLHPDVFKIYKSVLSPEDVVGGDDRKSLNAHIIGIVNGRSFAAPPLLSVNIPDSYDPINENRGEYAMGKLKVWNENLISTTTASKDFPGDHFAGYHVKTSQHFLSNIDDINRNLAVDPERGSLKIRLVHSGNEKALGLEGLVKKVVDSDLSKGYDQNNPVERTVLAVYVEHKRVNGEDQYHYVDAKGKRIEGTDHDNVVFQTMPAATKNYKEPNKNGQPVSRFRPKDTDEQIADAVSQAEAIRENLFKITTDKGTRHYSFNVSGGFPDLEHMMERLGADDEVIDMFRPKHSVIGRLIDRSLLDSGVKLLDIVTEPAGITTARGENIPAAMGTVWLNHETTLQYLNNRTLAKGEVETIVQLLKNYIDAKEGKVGINSRTKDKEKQDKLKGYQNTLEEIVDFLHGTTFFSDKRQSDPEVEKLATNNRMYFTNAGGLVVGAHKFPFTSLAFMDEERVDRLRDALSTIYTNANTTLLAKNSPFNELYLDKNGEINQRKWKTYQHFLLSDQYDLHYTDEKYDPKAKPEKRDVDDIPFRTSIKLKSDDITESNFDGKYSVLNDVTEVPRKEVKKEAKPKEEEQPKPKQPESKKPAILRGELSLEDYIKENSSLDNIAVTKETMKTLFPDAYKQFEAISDDQIGAAKVRKEAIADFLTYMHGLKKAELEKEQKDPNSATNQKKVEEIAKDEVKREPEVKKQRKPKNNTSSGEFRRVSPGEMFYTKHDLAKSKAWAEAKLPFTLLDPLKSLIDTTDGGFAFGQYQDDHISFYENAKKGTIEHESGEGVWASFMKDKQRQPLLKEFRGRTDSFVSHEDGRVIKYKDATDHEAKEEIMEELGRYILDGKLYEKPKENRNFIYRFFKAFMDFVKGVRDGSIKKWFDKIDAGYYKTAARVNDYTGKAEYKIGNQSITNSYAITKGVTVRLMQHLLDDNKSLANFDLKGYKVDKLFEKAYEELREDFEDDVLESVTADLEDGRISKEEFNRYQELWIDIKNNWDYGKEATEEERNATVKGSVLNYIKTFGVKSTEELEEFRPDNEFMKNAFDIDNNESMSASMKLMFGTMSRKVWTDDEGFGRTIIEMKDRSTRMPIPVDVTIMSNFMREQLSKVNTLTEKLAVLNDMVEEDPTVKTLINRLKLQDNSSPLTHDDLKVVANFNNVFSKQRPDANIHEIGYNFSITYPQNESSTKQRQTDAWFDSWKVLAEEQSTLMIRDEKTGNYKFNGEAIKGFDVKNVEDVKIGDKIIPGQLSFLKALHIDFTERMFNKLDGKDPQRFAAAVKRLSTYLPNQEVDDMDARKTGEAGNLAVIAELYLKANGVTDSTFYNIDKKQQSQDVGKNYVNSINTDISNAKSKSAFLTKYAHYDQDYRLDSVYLNNIFFDGETKTNKKPTTDYIQGIVHKDTANILPIGLMAHPERVMEEINQNLAKNYYVLVGADATTEWTAGLDHVISYQDMSSGRGDKQFYDIFNRYYQTEKGIADTWIKDSPYESTMIIDGLVKNYKADKLEEDAVKLHLENRVKDLIQYLKDNAIITEGSKDGRREGWTIKNMDTNFLKDNDIKNHFSDAELEDLFKFTEANYMINNVEMFKLYYGDPNAAKDWLKRIKSSLSPRESSVYGNKKFNDSLNTLLNKSGNVTINPLNPRYRLHDDFVKSVVLADHYSFIPHIVDDEYIENPDIKKGYKRNNDVDGAGWVNPTGHREVMYRRGQTTSDHDILYDYILANDNQLMLQDGHLHDRPGEWGYYTIEERARDKEVIKRGLKREDNTPIHASYDAIKPIVFGVDDTGKTVLHKYALAAGSYAQMRGGAMEKMYIEMLKNNRHYAVMESGVKIGVDATHSILNTDGTVNANAFAKDTMADISFQYFGVQTEVGGVKFKQSFLTQASTDVYLNSFGEGVPTDFMPDEKDSNIRTAEWHKLSSSDKATASKKHDLVQRHQDVLKEMQVHAYEGLMKRLGIVDNGNSYEIPDKKPIEKMLKAELLRRDTPQNLKDALTLDKNTGEFSTPLEAIANYKQIKDILYSYVDKVICKPKQNGAPLVLQPGLSMGAKDGMTPRTVSVKGKDRISYISKNDENTIRFYSAEYKNGIRTKVNPAEIVMTSDIPNKMRKHPRWKNATDKELIDYLRTKDPGILDVVGARIPTQEMNSLEAMTTKAFLPSYHGNAAMVGEGMTTKAGLDFDADKMNTYQKNIYMDDTGEVHQVPYYGTGEEAFAKFRELAAKLRDYEAAPTEEAKDEDEEYTEEELEAIEHDVEARAEDLYKKSLQNEYYRTMHQIILDPTNYERLIRPNSADDGKAIADTLEKTAPNEFSANSKGSLLSRMYMSQQRHYFLIGKREISKLAMGQKMHSMYQLSRVYLDPERFGNLLDQDKKFLGDGKLLLPHNKTIINGREYSTVSGIKDLYKKKFTSDSFSQFIDGTVDIAKGAWFMDIIQHPMMTSKLATLIHFGADEEQASFYLNQPILREFVKMLAADNNGFMLKGLDSKYRKALLELFPIGNTENPGKLIADRTKQGLDPSVLLDRIKEYYDPNRKEAMTFEKNLEQQMILTDFMKLTVMDGHLFDIQRGITYDTDSSGDPNLQHRKQNYTIKARSQNAFSSVDDILKSTHMNNLANLTDASSARIAEGAFKIGERLTRAFINKVLDKLPKSMSNDRFKRAANTVEESLLSYLLQTNSDNPIGARIKELLIDNTKTIIQDGKKVEVPSNMARRILEFRNSLPEDSDIANNIFLKELVVQTQLKAFDVKNVFMSRKPKLSQTADVYTAAIREFRDNPHVKNANIYEDLLTTAFLQSGISNSKISFSRFIPEEDYGRILGNIVDNISTKGSLEAWVRTDDFFRGQWHNQYIVPRIYEEYNRDFQGNPTYSEYRLSDEQLRAFHDLKTSASHPEYNAKDVKVSRNHALVKDYEIEGDKIIYKDHPNFDAVISNGEVRANNKGRDFLGKTPEQAADFLNRQKDDVKDRLGLTKLSKPETDTVVSYPHPDYTLFRFRPDTKEGQSQFVNFTAQYRANLMSMAKNPDIKERNMKYLLKRVNMDTPEGDNSAPVSFDGYYIFVPISPLGDGYNAEEHLDHIGNSQIVGNGYQVADEIPMWEIREALQKAQDEKIRRQNESRAVPVQDLVKSEETPTFDKLEEMHERLRQLEDGKRISLESHPDVAIANAMPRITPESAKKETGAKTGTNSDINPNFLSKNGKTVTQAAHEIFEDIGQSHGVDEQYIRNAIIEILQTGKKQFIDKITRQTEIDNLKKSIEEHGSNNVSREEMEKIFDNRDKDSYAKDENKELHLKELSNWIDQLKEQKPDITKEQIMEKIKCYFDAPF